MLFVDNIDSAEQEILKDEIRQKRGKSDPFYFDVVVATTFQDALIALLFNRNIQSWLYDMASLINLIIRWGPLSPL